MLMSGVASAANSQEPLLAIVAARSLFPHAYYCLFRKARQRARDCLVPRLGETQASVLDVGEPKASMRQALGSCMGPPRPSRSTLHGDYRPFLFDGVDFILGRTRLRFSAQAKVRSRRNLQKRGFLTAPSGVLTRSCTDDDAFLLATISFNSSAFSMAKRRTFGSLTPTNSRRSGQM